MIVLVVDALRPDHMGCFGYGRDTTPRIDGWAARSAVFERAYAQAPLTPTSVASLLTARYPAAHRLVGDGEKIVGGWRRDLMLTHWLQQDGWHTGCFSANPLIGPGWGFDAGFDHVDHLDWRDARTLNRALTDWISERLRRRERFFAYVHYMDPHDPYTPRRKAFGPDASRFEGGEINPYHEAIREGRDPGLGAADLDDMVSLYDAEVLETDREIGRLLAWMERHSLMESSAVALLADHGEAFMEHGWIKHGSTLYEEMIRIPLIVSAPSSSREGLRFAEPVEAIDVLPTLFGLCQVPVPEGLDGRDLLAEPAAADLSAEAPADWRGPGSIVYSMTWNGWDSDQRRRIVARTAVDDSWKLIDTPDLSRVELYRLDVDPGESRDLSADYPDVVQRLRRLLYDLPTSPTKPTSAVPPAEEAVNPEVLDQLRSMGYVE